MANVTRAERETEDRHKSGRTIVQFTHPEFGVSEYVIGLLAASDSEATRRATGLPVEAYIPSREEEWNRFGIDSVVVLWWLARRRSGEGKLAYKTVKALIDEDIANVPEIDLITPDDDVEGGDEEDPIGGS